MLKLVCSKCGHVIYEYSTQEYAGIPSPTWFKDEKCPKCGYKFKGKTKKIIFDEEVVYEH